MTFFYTLYIIASQKHNIQSNAAYFYYLAPHVALLWCLFYIHFVVPRYRFGKKLNPNKFSNKLALN